MCPFWDLPVALLHSSLASSYLGLKLRLPGLSLSLVWDQIRPCCQPDLASAMLKILFTAPQQSTHVNSNCPQQQRWHRAAPASLCWYQESCWQQVRAKAEAPCLSVTSGKRYSLLFCLSVLLKDKPYFFCLFIHEWCVDDGKLTSWESNSCLLISRKVNTVLWRCLKLLHTGGIHYVLFYSAVWL